MYPNRDEDKQITDVKYDWMRDSIGPLFQSLIDRLMDEGEKREEAEAVLADIAIGILAGRIAGMAADRGVNDIAKQISVAEIGLAGRMRGVMGALKKAFLGEDHA